VEDKKNKGINEVLKRGKALWVGIEGVIKMILISF
jgi:hypothetical protein